MQKFIKISLLILAIILINVNNYSQLMVEEFNYSVGQQLTSNGWLAFSGSGSNPILVTSSSLSYVNYPSSGIANSTQVIGTSGSREDVKKTFSSQNSNSVYASLLVNFANATTATDGDYFFGFLTSTGTTMKGRVFVKRTGADIAFGLSKGSTTPTLTTFSYSLNTTYLIVLKYTFNNSSSDDVVNLFVNPDLSGSEPTPTLTNADVSADLSEIGALALRQGSNTYDVTIDGVRGGTLWSEAPLPIELTSLTAKIVNSKIKLNWRTETEVNNYGFDILRQAQDDSWITIGFVEGSGNSNSPKEYSFLDENVVGGKYFYRLKQIDNDGTFEYSKVIEVDMDTPINYELSQNYPNPFNPETTINFTIPKSGFVKLSYYNILGELKGFLVNEFKAAGIHMVNLNASELISGVYVYKLEVNDFVKMRKMNLIK